jgi:hypothetical protein
MRRDLRDVESQDDPPSIPTPAIYPHQPATFEAQVLIHAVVRSVDPLFYPHLFRLAIIAAEGLLGANDFLANRFTALLLYLKGAIARADELATTAKG